MAELVVYFTMWCKIISFEFSSLSFVSLTRTYCALVHVVFAVLVLFGILPAAMSWSDRYSDSTELPKLPQLVPGGRLTLSLVIGGAGFVIFSELIENFSRAH